MTRFRLENLGLIVCVLCLLVTGCTEQRHSQLLEDKTTDLPQPIETNEAGHEEGENDQHILNWINAINRSAPGVNWRELERESARALAQSRPLVLGVSGIESFAGGQVVGTWEERGSKNQAGSVDKVAYVPETDQIYAFGAEVVNSIGGRSLWRGNRDGTGWTILNDDYFLEPRCLEAFFPQGSNAIRLVSAAHKTPMYSDDEGATWTESIIDITGNEGGPDDMLRMPGQPDTIYFLVNSFEPSVGGNRVHVYRSTDAGDTFNEVFATVTPNVTKAAIWAPKTGDKAYVIVGGHTLHIIDSASVTNVPTSGLPNQVDVEIAGAKVGNTTTIYVLADDFEIYKTTDEGASWQYVGNAPDNAGGPNFNCSPTDPDKLLFGFVNMFFSNDGGASWEEANHWSEYYSNIDLLHADMMHTEYAETSAGEEFLLVANHGGIHVTYDHFQETTNISKNGLNVSQYYDVLTIPDQPQYVFAGTQDQGWQWNENATSGGVLDFDQPLSGDYDGLFLTRNNQSWWNQFPFGFFRYTHTATDAGNGHNSSYDVNGQDTPYWYMPTAKLRSDPSGNSILVGGGSITGGSGSHLIKLTASVTGNHSITASQYNFDFRAAAGGSTLISAIEQPAHDPDLYYVTTQNGRFFRSEDGGTTWTMTVGHNGPGDTWIYNAYILASTINTDVVWTSGGGFGTPAVYKSTDRGETFEPMNNGLPDCRVQHLVNTPDESLMFAATSVGPFVYVAADDQWYSLLGATTPLNWYTAVEYIEALDTVRFSTFGRGIWDFRLETSQVVTVADSFNRLRGDLVSGDIAEAQESDDSYLKYNPGFTLNSDEPPVWLEFDGTLPLDSPDSLAVSLECSADTPGITQTLEAYDWTTDSYSVTGEVASSFNTDTVQTEDISNDVSIFVESGTGAIRTRIGWKKTGFTILFPWTICVDQVAWETE